MQLLTIIHRTYHLATEISETDSTYLIKSTYAFKLDPKLQSETIEVFVYMNVSHMYLIMKMTFGSLGLKTH